MIAFDRLTVTYDGADTPALVDVTLEIGEGELCLVIGPTGAGKSTLLGTVNGHVPHFTGGTLTGSVTVDGRDTRHWRPRDLADVVGVVGQDPVRGFVTDRVADELAYTMESLALPGPVMRRRVEDTLDLLGLVDLRDRPLASLSGGQQQRVAIGAALTANPKVLVLDEPTSALDPAAAEEVLAALHRLVHDLGVTVLLAEHRLERVIGTADTVLLIERRGARYGTPAEVMAVSPVVPPVIELARWAGWEPLPMTVRDARRQAAAIRATLPEPTAPVIGASAAATPHRATPRLEATALTGGYSRHETVLGPVGLTAGPGEILAVMGRNGAGKSTLLWALSGAMAPLGGRVTVNGIDPATLRPGPRRAQVALVPQQPADLLYRTTVADELTQADQDAGAAPGTAAALLAEIGPGLDHAGHPRDLSEGQRLELVLAVQLAVDPTLLLLDEPTRGLDYPAKARLTRMLRRLAAAGTTVIVASHDVEFVAQSCERVLILADGRVIADGPADDVLTASPTYAPQVAKILAPARVLTVGRARELLAAVR